MTPEKVDEWVTSVLWNLFKIFIVAFILVGIGVEIAELIMGGE